MALRTLLARTRLLGLVVALGATSLAASGCSNAQPPPSEEQTPKKWQGPVSTVIDTTLENGELSFEQEEAILAIRDRMEAPRADKGETKKKLRAAAVDIVRTGSADTEEFDRAVDEATKAMGKRVREGVEALEELHGLLDADQRSLVADALRDQVEERRAERVKKENSGEMKQVAKKLMLTAIQLGQLERLRDQMIGKHKEVKPSDEEIDAIIDAFEEENFPDVLEAVVDEKMALVREHLASAGGNVDAVLSILTPDQRGLLADWIAEGPQKAE